MEEALAEVGDFKIDRGSIINKVRFPNDRTIIVKTQKELQDIIKMIGCHGKEV